MRLPDAVTVEGRKLVLNGLGLREATIFGVDVFVAALYVEHRSSSAKTLLETDQHARVVLHFVRDTSTDEIIDELKTGLAANAPKVSRVHEKRLFGWVQDMHVGETMVFTYVPGKGLELRIKGRVKGSFPGNEFARDVLSVLIGPHPPTEDLRTGLLGGPCD